MAALGIVGGVAGHLQMLQNEGLVAEAGFRTAESEPSTKVLQKWLWLEIFGNWANRGRAPGRRALARAGVVGALRGRHPPVPRLPASVAKKKTFSA